MNQQKVYNLEEFATKYHIKDIYGAYAAYFSVSGFNSMVKERTLFTKILLVKQGSCRMLLQQTIGDEQSIQLAAKDLLIITPRKWLTYPKSPRTFRRRASSWTRHSPTTPPVTS